MKLEMIMCYSQLLYMMTRYGREFHLCVNKFEVDITHHPHEGISGYYETTVIFHLSNYRRFCDLLDAWHNISSEERMKFYPQ